MVYWGRWTSGKLSWSILRQNWKQTPPNIACHCDYALDRIEDVSMFSALNPFAHRVFLWARPPWIRWDSLLSLCDLETTDIHRQRRVILQLYGTNCFYFQRAAYKNYIRVGVGGVEVLDHLIRYPLCSYPSAIMIDINYWLDKNNVVRILVRNSAAVYWSYRMDRLVVSRSNSLKTFYRRYFGYLDTLKGLSPNRFAQPGTGIKAHVKSPTPLSLVSVMH